MHLSTDPSKVARVTQVTEIGIYCDRCSMWYSIRATHTGAALDNVRITVGVEIHDCTKKDYVRNEDGVWMKGAA